MPNPVAPSAIASDREETIIEWFQRNSRQVTIAAAIIGVAVVVYWFYTRSVEIKNQNAERAFNLALSSLQAQNAALAQSDLKKVLDRYGDTQAGIEAGMVLAQLRIEAGLIDSALVVLEKLTGRRAASVHLPAIYSLMGDAQLQARKPADAAKSYQKAADATKLTRERAWQLAKVARALTQAGDVAGATRVWEGLANDPQAPGLSNEAKVRLGELLAKPAKG